VSFAPFFVVVVIALVFFIKKINAYFVCVCARAHSFTGTVDRFNARASRSWTRLRERERVLFLNKIDFLFGKSSR